ncbi:hypothetical protein WA026_009612 [Henosepilachna vigintioctopunctata]|uniref:Uncharacterized protein n=1 Tax=Henosepilachna vigintioctopunctata TaxID=420089 RepID=A0AAW1U582_9CUCU
MVIMCPKDALTLIKKNEYVINISALDSIAEILFALYIQICLHRKLIKLKSVEYSSFAFSLRNVKVSKDTLVCKEGQVLLRGVCRNLATNNPCPEDFELIRGDCRAVIHTPNN